MTDEASPFTSTHMDKYERLRATLNGEAVDRLPVSLWRYWPGDDERVADFVQATVDFQRQYDWDFVMVNPFSAVFVADFGVQTARQDDIWGDRAITRYPITRSLDWTDLRQRDPQRGEMGKLLTALRMIRESLPDVPIVVPLQSPLSQARMLAPLHEVMRDLRTASERFVAGLDQLTGTTLAFIEHLRRVGVDGICYRMDAADFSIMAVEDYAEIALPHDRRIIDAFPATWWLNLLHMQGPAPMLSFGASYPLRALHWEASSTETTLEKARSLLPECVLAGGWSAQEHIYRGTPAGVRDVARAQISAAKERPFILTAGGPVPVATPQSNLRAAREAVEIPRVV